MPQNRKILVSEWITKADEDELNIKAILKHRDGTPSLVCFVCQQMSEKYLKALLLFYTGDIIKTHSIADLTNILDKHSSGLSDEIKKESSLLDPYYIKARYPADIPFESINWEMAEKAFESANKIKKIVLEKIS